MKHMIDLFSGMGGASEAFARSPLWSVERYERNAEFWQITSPNYVHYTRFWDVEYPRFLNQWDQVDLVWASPPCREFSQAYNAPGPKAMREGKSWEPDMEYLEKTIELIKAINPKYYVIENVAGAIPHFEKYLGEPTQKIGPFVLWGRFPKITLSRTELKEIKLHKRKQGDKHRWSPLRSNHRAKVPLQISLALLEAIGAQTTLDQWVIS